MSRLTLEQLDKMHSDLAGSGESADYLHSWDALLDYARLQAALEACEAKLPEGKCLRTSTDPSQDPEDEYPYVVWITDVNTESEYELDTCGHTLTEALLALLEKLAKPEAER